MAEEYPQKPDYEKENVPQKAAEEAPEEHPIYDTEWVKEIARQSWEPELIISGVAIYLSLNLHEGLDYLLDTFIYDISLDGTRGAMGLPLLIYAVFKSISTILAFTFIVHFIIRAFWVAIVGLLSVYPRGIVYKDLPFFNDFYKKQVENKLGRVENFILNLDRTASSIFSTSFIFVLTMTGVSFAYFFVFLLVNVSRLFMEKEVYGQYIKYLYFGMFFVGFGFAIFNLILNLKWVKNHPKWASLPFQINWRTGNILFPGVYRPLQYIVLMYYSNVSKTRIFVYAGGMMLFFMVSILYYTVVIPAPYVFETRSYGSSREDLYQIIPERYDNLRPQSRKSKSLSIQSDVIKDPYLRLFISYPKYLDNELKEYCPDWEYPKADSRYVKSIFGDSARLACLKRFFEVFIDDKAFLDMDLRYGKHADSRELGFISIIPLDGLSPGIHRVSLRKANRDSTGSRPYSYNVTFWYYPR